MTDRDNRTDMKRQLCSPSNSILDGDLELAARHQIIEKLKVMETPTGFYVIAEFSDKFHVLDRNQGKGLPVSPKPQADGWNFSLGLRKSTATTL